MDEGFDVASYVGDKIKKLEKKELNHFIGELSIELYSLCPQDHIGKTERRRMIAFRDAMVPVLGDYGWVLEACKGNSCASMRKQQFFA